MGILFLGGMRGGLVGEDITSVMSVCISRGTWVALVVLGQRVLP